MGEIVAQKGIPQLDWRTIGLRLAEAVDPLATTGDRKRQYMDALRMIRPLKRRTGGPRAAEKERPSDTTVSRDILQELHRLRTDVAALRDRVAQLEERQRQQTPLDWLLPEPIDFEDKNDVF